MFIGVLWLAGRDANNRNRDPRGNGSDDYQTREKREVSLGLSVFRGNFVHVHRRPHTPSRVHIFLM
jgi:hypothetical protein